MQTRRENSNGVHYLSLLSTANHRRRVSVRFSTDPKSQCRHMCGAGLGLAPLALDLPPLAVAYLVSWTRRDLGMQGTDPYRQVAGRNLLQPGFRVAAPLPDRCTCV